MINCPNENEQYTQHNNGSMQSYAMLSTVEKKSIMGPCPTQPQTWLPSPAMRWCWKACQRFLLPAFIIVIIIMHLSQLRGAWERCLPSEALSLSLSLPRLLSVLTLHLTAVWSSVLTRRFLHFSAACEKNLLSSPYSCHYLMTFSPLTNERYLKAGERELWCCQNDRHGSWGLCFLFYLYILSLFLSYFEGDYLWTDIITGEVFVSSKQVFIFNFIQALWTFDKLKSVSVNLRATFFVL